MTWTTMNCALPCDGSRHRSRTLVRSPETVVTVGASRGLLMFAGGVGDWLGAADREPGALVPAFCPTVAWPARPRDSPATQVPPIPSRPPTSSATAAPTRIRRQRRAGAGPVVGSGGGSTYKPP